MNETLEAIIQLMSTLLKCFVLWTVLVERYS